MRRFYLAHEENLQHAAKLTWTQHVALLPVKNSKARRSLERKIVRQKLSYEQIRQTVQALSEAKPTADYRLLNYFDFEKRPQSVLFRRHARNRHLHAIAPRAESLYLSLRYSIFIIQPSSLILQPRVSAAFRRIRYGHVVVRLPEASLQLPGIGDRGQG